MMNKYLPTVIVNYIKDITYKKPEEGENLNKRTLKSIKHAFDDAILDKRGIIWIDSSRLHTLLRIGTKANGKYFLEKVREENKMIIDNKTYIRGYVFIAFIQKRIEEHVENHYLPLIKECFNNIDESEKVKLVRREFMEANKESVKKLKSARIKRYKIDKDELTNEKLNRRTAEFSHIRSVLMYVEYSDNVENGLVVNKETHDCITGEGINEEEALRDLCVKKHWNIDWYKKYKETFR